VAATVLALTVASWPRAILPKLKFISAVVGPRGGLSGVCVADAPTQAGGDSALCKIAAEAQVIKPPEAAAGAAPTALSTSTSFVPAPGDADMDAAGGDAHAPHGHFGALPPPVLELIASRAHVDDKHNLRTACRAGRAAVNATSRTLALLRHPSLQQLRCCSCCVAGSSDCGGAGATREEPATTLDQLRRLFPNATKLILADQLSEFLVNSSMASSSCGSESTPARGACNKRKPARSGDPSCASRSSTSSSYGSSSDSIGRIASNCSLSSDGFWRDSGYTSGAPSPSNSSSSEGRVGSSGGVFSRRRGAAGSVHSAASSASLYDVECSVGVATHDDGSGGGGLKGGRPGLGMRPATWWQLQHVVFQFDALTGEWSGGIQQADGGLRVG
jgi:hypothetical protein